MRRIAVGTMTITCILLLSVVLCSCDSSDSSDSGTVVPQTEDVVAAAVADLGSNGPDAILSAHGKGYSLRQIVEGILDGALAVDGEISGVAPSMSNARFSFAENRIIEENQSAVMAFILGMITAGYDQTQITLALTIALDRITNCTNVERLPSERQGEFDAICITSRVEAFKADPMLVGPPALDAQPGVLAEFEDSPDDDPPESSTAWILGAWRESGASPAGGHVTIGTLTFSADGTFIDDYDEMVVLGLAEPSETVHRTITGGWTLVGETLTLEVGGELMTAQAPEGATTIVLEGASDWVIKLER